jgi:leucyl/phenylalanyl-tRNA--protein transferase
VGGAYGVSIGRMFYGESMFARVTDASKIALAYLVAFLRSEGVTLIDCQQETSHLASLGAAPVSRAVFLDHLRRAIAEPAIACWQPVPPLMDAR